MARAPLMPEFNPETDSWASYSDRLTHAISFNEITDANKQIQGLLTSVGGQTYDLLVDLCSPQMPHERSYAQLVELLKKHYEPKHLVASERYKFRQMQQATGQTISQFLAALRKAASKCNFGQSLEDALRDQLIAGIKSDAIRRRILQEANVDLAKATELAQTAEATENGLRSMQPRSAHSAAASVDKIQASSSPYKKNRRRRFALPKPFQSSAQQSQQQSKQHFQGKPAGHRYTCGRCNSDNHRADDCRFKEAECRICRRKGHIARACRSRNKPGQHFNRRANNVVEAEEALASEFESHVAIQHLTKVDQTRKQHSNNADDRKMITLSLDGRPVILEIDTGSGKTLLSQQTWQDLGKPNLASPDCALISYSGHTVGLKGQCKLQVKHGGQCEELSAYVVNGSATNLLGREWLNVLKLDWSKVFPVRMIKPNAVSDLLAKYADLFKPGLGTLKGIQAKIHLKPGSIPRFHKARPIPYSIKQLVEDDLARLVESGVLVKVDHSEWACPIVPIIKDTGRVRTCGDFRCTINPCLDVDQYPMPRPTELFHSLNGGQKFSRLDLAEAYLQVPVDPESVPLLTINTHKGLYSYKRLPFGVASCPAVFQKTIDTVLQGLKGTGAYQDDITVTGGSDEEHMANLEAVLQRLQQYGLRLKKEKCVFFQDSVEYLGFVIDKSGIRPNPKKVAAVTAMPAPTNVSEVRSFMGMCQHYGQFIKSLSSIAAPINRLTQDGTPWQWGPEQQKAFAAIKTALTSMNCLVHYDPSQKLTLACDASSYGIGAVLSHRYDDGSERPIAFASKSLSSAQKNYAQIEKEALSIIFGLEKFSQYLWGRHFFLITDHKPLLSIFSPSKGVSVTALSRLQRWQVKLGCFNYTIEFRPTTKHCSADGLSRLVTGPDDEFDQSEASESSVSAIQIAQIQVLPVDFKLIQSETRKDAALAKVLNFAIHGWPTTCDDASILPFFRRREEITVQDGVAIWGMRTIIPASLQAEMLDELHHTHSGMVRMKAVARSHVWWPKMDQDIEATARQCPACNSNAGEPRQAPVQPWAFPSQPWARLHIDFCHALGSTYLIVIDAHSKWLEAINMHRGTSAEHTITALRDVFANQGLCRTLVSDNGPPFTSAEFEDFCVRNGIEHKTPAPYNPSSNGEAERAVQTFKSALRSFEGATPAAKQKAVANFLLVYRTTPHATTNVSPAELLNKRQLRTRLSLVHPNATATAERNQQRQVEVRNKSRPLRQFSPGDLVWARDFRGANKWTPGKVSQVLGTHNYIVVVKLGDKTFEWRRHINQLRKFEHKVVPLSPKGMGAPKPPPSPDATATGTTSSSETATPAKPPAPAKQPPPPKTYPLRSRGNVSASKFVFANFVLCATISLFCGASAANAVVANNNTKPATTPVTATTTAVPLVTGVTGDPAFLQARAKYLADRYELLESIRVEMESTSLSPQRRRALELAYRFLIEEEDPPDMTDGSEGQTSPATPPEDSPSQALTSKSPRLRKPLASNRYANLSSFLSHSNVSHCNQVSPTWALVDQCKQQYYWLMAITLTQAIIITILIAKLCRSQCGICNYAIRIQRHQPTYQQQPNIQLQPLLPPPRVQRLI